jgi:selenocysteine-specific elongation factor
MTRPLTIGTAGHIDHGKTWLVRALTGKDTDRLPEEQARGISIDLGYAPLDLPDGRRLSVVDVPGHERFVRTMVAGATGIDLFLLAIDAGEGARPQTREHLAVLRLLGIDRGVIALTKVDAVDAETRELAAEEARELVPGVQVVPVSAQSGEGLDELRAAIASVAAEIPDRAAAQPTRLFVDRAFALHGIGTVATGTLWSGAIGEGDILQALPGSVEARVRSVQVHDRPVERVMAGQRVALAVPGLERSELPRGTALVEPGSFPVSFRLDVMLDELEPVPNGHHVQVHHGTAEHTARVVRVGERCAQLRLATQAVAARGDHVVLRTDRTLAGGTVLDPAPPRHASADRFELLERGDFGPLVHAPVPAESLRWLGDLDGVERAGDWIFSRAWLEEFRADLHARLAAADPLDPGLPPPSQPWARDILPLLGMERRGARLYLPGATTDLGEHAAAADELARELDAAGFEPAKVEDRALVAFLEGAGTLVRVGDGLVVGRGAYDEARKLLVQECASTGSITLARFRDLLGTGRRPAQLLLERFDADGLTRRVGDARVLRKTGSEASGS